MKVIHSISNIYHDQLKVAEVLKNRVDLLILTKKEKAWHYVSRIKEEKSFALKVEAGKTPDPSKLEDFFAATLVVENLDSIKKAYDFINNEFEIKYKRPEDDKITKNTPSSFMFDDLRLYIQLPKLPHLPDEEITKITFEIQIKTFLQHAWGIATHDLSYKSNTISWSKQRIVFQIKAMLEQAEISISGVDDLSKLAELDKENKEIKELNIAKEFLENNFKRDSLPPDLIRLSGILESLRKNLGIDYSDLKIILDIETLAGKGVETLNLSPYGIILQSIANQKPELIAHFFSTKNKINKGVQLFVPKEINLGNIIIEDISRMIQIK